MDPSQGETQGKSMTSKLKAKVKGVKGKVHLPGHKKRHGGDGQANEGDSSDYSSDDSSKKPGSETGYNVGASTPFTTVRTTPLSPARERPSSHETHNHDYNTRPSHTTSDSPPSMDDRSQYRDGSSTTPRAEGMAMTSHDDNPSSPNKPREGVLGRVKDSVGGAAAAVGSKMGYYAEVDDAPAAPSPTDPNAPSLMDKAKATLGMDKPSDPNTPTLLEKTKATLGLGPSSPNAVTSPSQPGVVDRVTGAMSSLFTSSPKESSTGESVQHTFPAQSDYLPTAARGSHGPYGDRSGEGGMASRPTEEYNRTTNQY